MEGTMATIMMFAGNFAPKNWAFCAGQILPISQNTALFSLLGVTYGGNGTSNFALPNLVGRMPIGAGTSNYGQTFDLGETSGTTSVTLLSNNLPAHSHSSPTIEINVSGNTGNLDQPNGNALATSDGINVYSDVVSGNAAYGGMRAQVGPMGNNAPMTIQQPYMNINFVICMYGVFPYRN
jgi:microcystin-dependent protein